MSAPTPTARPLRPSHSAAQDTLAPWLIVAGAAGCALVATAGWLAGGVLTWWHTHDWPDQPWSLALLPALLGQGRWPWPAAQPQAVQGLTATILTLVLVPVGVAATTRRMATPRSDSAYRSLGLAHQVEHLQLPAQRTTAVRLRRSTLPTPAAVQPGDAGLALGRVDTGHGPGPRLFAGWEDVLLAVMAPRSGKTTCLAIPAICSAPGAVIATSNKLDILFTADVRHRATGLRPWVFDPQHVARTPQTWWWDPLAGITTVEEAERLAMHFISTVEDDTKSIWPMSATELLSALLLAANLIGADLRQVYRWLADEHDPSPAAALEAGGFDVLAGSLRGLRHAAPETRASVYFTARSGARCLRNPEITAWVTPPRRPMPCLDPVAFLRGRNTLYLLSKDSGGSAAPLVAALTDRVLRAGERAAEANGGRLDPPLVVVLDEAASVAPIRDLPVLYSHYGSRGIVLLTILQSLAQGQAVWGQTGMETLWGAATIKVIGSGIDSEAVASQISRLVGEHDVATVSVTSGRSGSRSTSLTPRPILSPAQVRALPKGRALLLATGTPIVLLTLEPYYRGPHAPVVDAAAAALVARIAKEAS